MRKHRLAAPRTFFVCAALSLGLIRPLPSAGAAPVDPDAARITLGTRSTRLANGLEVVLHEDHRTPIVAVNLWYHVGSKDEAPGHHGFAHLFEHVMFQGSKHVPEDTYFRDLERAGASDVNGSTAEDRTNYHETVPRNRLELALWLESDRMGFLLDHVDQQTFAGQRDVVKNERRQNYENSPYGMVPQYLAEALFPPLHPYHHLAIGSPEDLDAASLDDVKQFFRTWYVPNNATLVIAGDIDPDATLALVQQYFGPIPSGPLPARIDQANPPKVELAGERRLEIEAGVELPRVIMAWVTPRYFAPGDADLDLVARVLAAGKTSRLYKRMVYDEQIAQDVQAFQASAQLASRFQIAATAKPGHPPEELLEAIQQEVQRLQSGSLDEPELSRARTAFLADEAFGLEGVGERADRINSFFQYTGNPDYLSKDVARYEEATTKTLIEAARRWLPLDRRVVAIIRPVKGAPLSGRLLRSLP